MNVVIPATMAEAKNRWRTHTRHVLTDDAIRLFKGAKWRVSADGYPCIVGQGVYVQFEKSNGLTHVWGHFCRGELR